jgi:hypothetical protein
MPIRELLTRHVAEYRRDPPAAELSRSVLPVPKRLIVNWRLDECRARAPEPPKKRYSKLGDPTLWTDLF